MSGCFRATLLCAVLGCFGAPLLHAGPMVVKFDFNSEPVGTTATPLVLSNGLSATFSASPGAFTVEPNVADPGWNPNALMSSSPPNELFIHFNYSVSRVDVYFASDEYDAMVGETLEMSAFGLHGQVFPTLDVAGYNSCYSHGNLDPSSCGLHYPEGVLSLGFAGAPDRFNTIEITTSGDAAFAIEQMYAVTPVPEPPAFALVLLGLMALARPCVSTGRHRMMR